MHLNQTLLCLSINPFCMSLVLGSSHCFQSYYKVTIILYSFLTEVTTPNTTGVLADQNGNMDFIEVTIIKDTETYVVELRWVWDRNPHDEIP